MRIINILQGLIFKKDLKSYEDLYDIFCFFSIQLVILLFLSFSFMLLWLTTSFNYIDLNLIFSFIKVMIGTLIVIFSSILTSTQSTLLDEYNFNINKFLLQLICMIIGLFLLINSYNTLLSYI